MKRIAVAALALHLFVAPAWAQMVGGGGSSSLVVGTSPVTGGTNSQCLYINAGVLGNQVCGSLTVGTSPIIGGGGAAQTCVLYQVTGTNVLGCDASFTYAGSGGGVTQTGNYTVASGNFTATTGNIAVNTQYFIQNNASGGVPALVMNGPGNYGQVNQVNSNTWCLAYSGAAGTNGTCTVSWTDNGAVTIAPNNSVMAVTGKVTATALQGSGTPPTTTGSTCGTIGTQLGGNSMGSIVLTCTAQNLVLNFASTAPNFWQCDAEDMTTPADLIRQTARGTTSATFGTITTAASDVVQFKCFAY